MKKFFNKYIFRSAKVFVLFVSLINIINAQLSAEESYLKDIQIDSSTKLNDNSSDLPTNPFEIVEMLRRANSMNDATKPSDALDDAIKSFNKIGDKKNL